MVPDPASASPPSDGGAPARRRRAAGSAHPPRPHRRRRTPFYAEALDAGDRADLADAAAVRGLDQEIAVLRLRVRQMLAERPDDIALLVRSIELLVRAVGTAARVASADSNELLERITAELGGIVELLAEADAE